MIELITKIGGPILSWLAAKGIDALIGKWLAYFTIAWEQFASNSAKDAFNAAMADLKSKSVDHAKAWEDWRDRATDAK
jgi:hypothetical protein